MSSAYFPGESNITYVSISPYPLDTQMNSFIRVYLPH